MAIAPSGVVSLRITFRSVVRRASATMAGLGRKKKITGARRPTRISGAPSSAISRCWAMWSDSRSSASVSTGEISAMAHSATPP